jgi:hypothetical protein
MHALTRMGVDEIDLEGVTAVEQAGLALCLVAANRHGSRSGRNRPVLPKLGPGDDAPGRLKNWLPAADEERTVFPASPWRLP